MIPSGIDPERAKAAADKLAQHKFNSCTCEGLRGFDQHDANCLSGAIDAACAALREYPRAIQSAEQREREACAKMAEEAHAVPPPFCGDRGDMYAYAVAHGANIAAAIRGRKGE